MTPPAGHRSKRDDPERRVGGRDPAPPGVIAASLAPRLRSQLLLHKAAPELAFEVGYEGPGAPRVLVISADGMRDRFGTVKRLVAAAPKVSGWRIVAFRQRRPELEVQYSGVRLHLPADPRAAGLRPLAELASVVDAAKALGPER